MTYRRHDRASVAALNAADPDECSRGLLGGRVR